MKKIMFAALALMTSMAFAGSVTVEGTNYNTLNGGNDAKGALVAFNENINKTFGVYTALSSLQTVNTNAVSSRLEVGGSANFALGPVTGYTKLGIGQKYSTTGQFTYWQIEPGVKAPIGDTGLTAQLGYRYRTAAENPNVNKDTTDTVRVGLGYNFNKHNNIGVRYDRVTGDTRQDAVSLNYTRSF
jgi:hypothetical protein